MDFFPLILTLATLACCLIYRRFFSLYFVGARCCWLVFFSLHLIPFFFTSFSLIYTKCCGNLFVLLFINVCFFLLHLYSLNLFNAKFLSSLKSCVLFYLFYIYFLFDFKRIRCSCFAWILFFDFARHLG